MSKQKSSEVRVQAAAEARRMFAEAQSSAVNGWMSWRPVDAVAAGWMLLLLAPALAGADPRRTNDPIDPQNPPAIVLNVSDNAVVEGQSGSTLLRFKVDVSPVSSDAITVSYRVVDGSATCAGGDYQDCVGTLTIPAGASSVEIPVVVNGDKTWEPDETLRLVLSDANNAQIVRGTAVGTILNDDPRGGGGGGGGRRLPDGMTVGIEGDQPRRTNDPIDPQSPADPAELSVSDNAVYEGQAGATTLWFRVNVSPVSADAITVAYKVLDGSASCADHDYQDCRGTLTIPAGASSVDIPVTVNGDKNWEADETLTLVLSDATNAQIVRGAAVGTILNDDVRGGGGGPRHLPNENSFDLACANPVRGRPSFQFALARAGHVSIAIYDLAGRMVGQPMSGEFSAGSHRQTWNQDAPANGIYFARLSAEGRTFTRRFTLD
jgi:hypothetical protein